MTVQELSGSMEVCVILLKYQPGQSAEVILHTNTTGLAVGMLLILIHRIDANNIILEQGQSL